MLRRRVLSNLTPYRNSGKGFSDLSVMEMGEVPITEWYSMDGSGNVKNHGRFEAWVICFSGSLGEFIAEMDKMDITNYFLGAEQKGVAIFKDRGDAVLAYLKLKG